MYLYYYSYPDARALVENSSALYICTLTVSKHNNFKLFVYTINLSLSLDIYIYIYIYIYYNFIIHIRKRDLVAGLEAQHVLDGVEDHLRPIHELRVCRWNGNG